METVADPNFDDRKRKDEQMESMPEPNFDDRKRRAMEQRLDRVEVQLRDMLGLVRELRMLAFPDAVGQLETAPTNGEPNLDELSRREMQVLRLLLAGERVGGIARALHVSPHTVRNHLKAIFRKLGVHSQVELLLQFSGKLSVHE